MDIGRDRSCTSTMSGRPCSRLFAMPAWWQREGIGAERGRCSAAQIENTCDWILPVTTPWPRAPGKGRRIEPPFQRCRTLASAPVLIHPPAPSVTPEFEEVLLLFLDQNQACARVFCAAANVSGGSAIERKTSDLGRRLQGFSSFVCAETEPGIVCHVMRRRVFSLVLVFLACLHCCRNAVARGPVGTAHPIRRQTRSAARHPRGRSGGHCLVRGRRPSARPLIISLLSCKPCKEREVGSASQIYVCFWSHAECAIYPTFNSE
jgi:hypothetical protein